MSAAQRQRDAVSDERREISQAKQVTCHHDHITPRVGFAFDCGERRDALRREHVPRQQRERGGEWPSLRDHRRELVGDLIACSGKCVHRAERANGDFARREAGDQRDRNLPIKTDRREDDFERTANDAGETVLNRRAGRAIGRRRECRQEPQQNHQASK